jgi:hypothetical protein
MHNTRCYRINLVIDIAPEMTLQLHVCIGTFAFYFFTCISGTKRPKSIKNRKSYESHPNFASADEMAVYSRDPSAIDIMKEEMKPKGRGCAGEEAAYSWGAGTQRKPRGYMEPSKHVCVRPRNRKTESNGGRET